jgi:hypothetical protein
VLKIGLNNLMRFLSKLRKMEFMLRGIMLFLNPLMAGKIGYYIMLIPGQMMVAEEEECLTCKNSHGNKNGTPNFGKPVPNITLPAPSGSY